MKVDIHTRYLSFRERTISMFDKITIAKRLMSRREKMMPIIEYKKGANSMS
jgi:hypothetical protein